MSGSLNGIPLTRAAVTLPRWGAWWADVTAASGELQEGAATIELAGLSLVGTIVRGGVYQDTGTYRIVGGAGGWRKVIREFAYRNAGGVRLATVLGDAAREAGETLGTVDSPRRIGGAYVRPKAEASRVLDEFAREAWYVDEAGVTQIGARPAAAFSKPYVVMDERPSAEFLTVAAEDIAGLVPGATLELEGIEVSSVRHELTAQGIRSHLWGSTDQTNRVLDAFRRLVEWITGRTFFLGSYEYRVDAFSGGYVDVSPVSSSMGLPKLVNVPLRVGVPGGGGEPDTGSSCVVRFLNGDPTRPYVCDLEGEYGATWEPVSCKVGGDDALVRNAPFAQWVASVESGVIAAGGSVAPNMATIIANPAYGPHATQITRGA